jgi:hypothetical protein
VPSAVVDNYFSQLTAGKEDRDLEIASYEGVLYDLRRKERELLNDFRAGESRLEGEPEERWWERRDKGFNVELRKERLLGSEGVAGGEHRAYVGRLKNGEIY